MAGDWIKLRCDLKDDPAVIKMAGDLAVPVEHVCGCLGVLWSWFNEQTVDGHAPSGTGSWLDGFVHLPGFTKAMVEAGWLEADNGGLTVPKWGEHNSDSAKKRALDTRRRARSRAKPRPARVRKVSGKQADENGTPNDRGRERERGETGGPSGPSPPVSSPRVTADPALGIPETSATPPPSSPGARGDVASPCPSCGDTEGQATVEMRVLETCEKHQTKLKVENATQCADCGNTYHLREWERRAGCSQCAMASAIEKGTDDD